MARLLLIVDDDAASRHAMDVFFRRSGFRTRLAGDGLEALGQAAAETPDLIILDLAMPRLDGLTFLRALREVPSLAGVPVLVTSSRSDVEAARGAAALGVVGYLVKTGYTLKDLLVTVRRHVGAEATPAPHV
jgi:CheY-like chemotaxis protein